LQQDFVVAPHPSARALPEAHPRRARARGPGPPAIASARARNRAQARAMAGDFPMRPQAAALHPAFSDLSSGSGSTSPSQQSKEPSEASCPSSGRKGPSPDQRNKVFVGGVPQDYTQEDLKKLFQEYAPVKRAWVQQHKTKRSATERSAPQNHRGFGWVIFQDPVVKKDPRGGPTPAAEDEGRGSYVDAILGSDDSRLLPLGDGRHVEVKRAKDAQEMKDATQGHQPTIKAPAGPAARGLVVGGRGPSGTGAMWPAATGLGPIQPTMRPPPPGLPPPPAPGALLQIDSGRPQVPAHLAAGHHREQGARELGGSWPTGRRPGSPVRVPYPPPNPVGAHDPIYCRAPVYSNRLIAKDEVYLPAASHGQERLINGIPPRAPPPNTVYI